MKKVLLGVAALGVLYLLCFFVAGAFAVIDPEERKAAMARWRGVDDDDWPRP